VYRKTACGSLFETIWAADLDGRAVERLAVGEGGGAVARGRRED
jgi:hypothetical protein